MDIGKVYEEVSGYLDSLDVDQDGEHLWSNYQEVTAILIRLSQIKNEVAFEELTGKATPALKKFRTTILEPIIERFEKVAIYESRKITARQAEWEMEKR